MRKVSVILLVLVALLGSFGAIQASNTNTDAGIQKEEGDDLKAGGAFAEEEIDFVTVTGNEAVEEESPTSLIQLPRGSLSEADIRSDYFKPGTPISKKDNNNNKVDVGDESGNAIGGDRARSASAPSVSSNSGWFGWLGGWRSSSNSIDVNSSIDQLKGSEVVESKTESNPSTASVTKPLSSSSSSSNAHSHSLLPPLSSLSSSSSTGSDSPILVDNNVGATSASTSSTPDSDFEAIGDDETGNETIKAAVGVLADLDSFPKMGSPMSKSLLDEGRLLEELMAEHQKQQQKQEEDEGEVDDGDGDGEIGVFEDDEVSGDQSKQAAEPETGRKLAKEGEKVDSLDSNSSDISYVSDDAPMPNEPTIASIPVIPNQHQQEQKSALPAQIDQIDVNLNFSFSDDEDEEDSFESNTRANQIPNQLDTDQIQQSTFDEPAGYLVDGTIGSKDSVIIDIADYSVDAVGVEGREPERKSANVPMAKTISRSVTRASAASSDDDAVSFIPNPMQSYSTNTGVNTSSPPPSSSSSSGYLDRPHFIRRKISGSTGGPLGNYQTFRDLESGLASSTSSSTGSNNSNGSITGSSSSAIVQGGLDIPDQKVESIPFSPTSSAAFDNHQNNQPIITVQSLSGSSTSSVSSNDSNTALIHPEWPDSPITSTPSTSMSAAMLPSSLPPSTSIPVRSTTLSPSSSAASYFRQIFCCSNGVCWPCFNWCRNRFGCCIAFPIKKVKTDHSSGNSDDDYNDDEQEDVYYIGASTYNAFRSPQSSPPGGPIVSSKPVFTETLTR